jgi:hypothetical protein
VVRTGQNRRELPISDIGEHVMLRVLERCEFTFPLWIIF